MYRLKAITAIVLSTTFISACVDDHSGQDSDKHFDYTELLVNLADNVFIPHYENGRDKSAGLLNTISSYCESINTPSEAASLEASRTAWLETMDAIQITEMHALGPALFDDSSLRYRIYSRDQEALNTCGIDQAVVKAQESTLDITSRSTTQRGIGAIEYALFNSSLEFTDNCPIPEKNTWNSYNSTQKKQARCQYAKLVADDINRAFTEVIDAWSVDKGNYRSIFINPANIDDSITAVSDGLFYLDPEVQDKKMGIPLGIDDACGSLSCPESVESPYTQSSLQHIKSNLAGFLAVFNGGAGTGFDDLIRFNGFADVSTNLNNQAQAAITKIDTIDKSLFELSSAIDTVAEKNNCINAYNAPQFNSSQPGCTLYGLIKLLNDDLKSDFTTIVNVDLPQRAQSDND